MSELCELTITELGLVAGGDAGFALVLDDGVATFSGSGFSQPTSSGIMATVNGTADSQGSFEATIAVFANTGLPED